MDVIIEIVGYLGMVIVVTSFLFKNIKWVRIVNIIGATLCALYGFLTKTYPTAILNAALIVINAIMLIRLFVSKKK